MLSRRSASEESSLSVGKIFTNKGTFMSKVKKSKYIGQNEDGSYYCSKCGQSGFSTASSGYGHLTHCKGYKAVIKESKKEQDTVKGMLASIHDELTLNEANVGTLRPCLDPASGPQTGPASSSMIDAFRKMSERLENEKREKVILLAQNKNLERIAYNHNQHVGNFPAKSFSGPADLVASGFGDIVKIPAVRYIVGAIALVVLINYGLKVFEETRLITKIETKNLKDTSYGKRKKTR